MDAFAHFCIAAKLLSSRMINQPLSGGLPRFSLLHIEPSFFRLFFWPPLVQLLSLCGTQATQVSLLPRKTRKIGCK